MEDWKIGRMEIGKREVGAECQSSILRRGRARDCSLPPAQTPACGVTAPGSSFMSNGHALIRVRMHYGWSWQPFACQAGHPIPGDIPSLASPTQRLLPEFDDGIAKATQGRQIARHPVIPVVPAQHLSEPLPHVPEWFGDV